MNRHVRNHVRHMFYNDYNRRHPKPRRDKGHKDNKHSNNTNSNISLGESFAIVLTFGLIVVLYILLCQHVIWLGVVFTIIFFLTGLWPIAIFTIIIMFLKF